MNQALGDLAEDAVEKVGDAITWTPVFILGIVVGAMILRWILFRIIRSFVRKATSFAPRTRLISTRSGRVLFESDGLLVERREQRVQALGSAMRSLTSFTVALFAGLMVLGQLNINTLPAVAGASVAAAAIAFGAQQIVRDFLTGAFLLVEDQFGVGDYVDLGSVAGRVEAVGLRITQLRDDTGMVWYVRNGEIVRVGNRAQGWSNAVVDVPVPYDADLQEVRQLLADVGAGLRGDSEWAEDVLADPVVTGPESLAADHVVMRITVRSAPGEHFDVQRELRERVRDKLAAHGLQIAAVTPAPPAQA